MIPTLGSKKTLGAGLYQNELHSPSHHHFQAFKAKYGPKQESYLSKIHDSDMYSNRTGIEDTITKF